MSPLSGPLLQATATSATLITMVGESDGPRASTMSNEFGQHYLTLLWLPTRRKGTNPRPNLWRISQRNYGRVR